MLRDSTLKTEEKCLVTLHVSKAHYDHKMLNGSFGVFCLPLLGVFRLSLSPILILFSPTPYTFKFLLVLTVLSSAGNSRLTLTCHRPLAQPWIHLCSTAQHLLPDCSFRRAALPSHQVLWSPW